MLSFLMDKKPINMGCCSSSPVSGPSPAKPAPAANPTAPLAPPSNPAPIKTSPIIIGQKSKNKIPSLDLDNIKDPSNIIENLNTVERRNIKNPNTEEIKNEENPKNDEGKIKENLDNEEKSGLENKSNSIVINESNSLCPEGHTYNWRSDLVYCKIQNASLADLSQPSTYHIQCSECSKIFSKPGWQCQNCASILCESCGSSTYQKSVLYCKKNHELIWCIDSWALNIETNKSTKSSITCNACHKSYQEPAYVCRECNFYSCISCSNKKGVKPPNNLLVCDNGCENKHLLTLQSAKDVVSPCRICGNKVSGNAYKSNDCEYVTCQLCGIKNTLKMLRHPGVKCRNSHPAMVLNDFRNMPKTHKYKCLACYCHGFKFGMFCVYCGEAYCLKCSDKLQSFLENFIGKNSADGSIIEWFGTTDFDQEETFTCSSCSKSELAGLYFYDQQNRFCTDCVSSLN